MQEKRPLRPMRFSRKLLRAGCTRRIRLRSWPPASRSLADRVVTVNKIHRAYSCKAVSGTSLLFKQGAAPRSYSLILQLQVGKKLMWSFLKFNNFMS